MTEFYYIDKEILLIYSFKILFRHNPESQLSNGAERPHSEQYKQNTSVPRNQQMRSSHKPTSNNDLNSAFIRSQQCKYF